MEFGKGKDENRKCFSTWDILNRFLFALLLLGTFCVGYTIFSNNILGFRYLDIILMIFFSLILLFSAYMILKKKARKPTFILLVLGITLNLTVFFVAQQFLTITKNINKQSNFVETEMAVYIKKESNIDNIKIKDIMLMENSENEIDLQNLPYNIKEARVTYTDSYLTAYDALDTGKVQAIIMNAIYEDILENSNNAYSKKFKKVYSYKVKKNVKMSAKAGENAEVFNIYISGIDTYGPITSVSRSDVNIIMSVNRKTKKVLLTTTPRDAYIPIADGGKNKKDKLTHAGIYGIDASIHTLENLYNIKIDYYIRLNFTSFLTLIDSVGGVNVYNDQEFTSYHGKFHFPVGMIHLNSKQALGFVRERYSLERGDYDRGKNQEKIIAALIDKLTSPQVLKNYNDIIKKLQISVQTDIKLPVMMNLINTQLETGSSYKVDSQAVTGKGRKDLPSYAMPGARLYMLEIDENNLNAAKKAMQKIMEGK